MEPFFLRFKNAISRQPTVLLIWFISVLVLIPKGVFSAEGIGLDPSWAIGLNLAIDANLIWGKELVFTYGPLGYLVTQLPDFQNKIIMILFFCLRIGIAAFFLFYTFKAIGFKKVLFLFLPLIFLTGEFLFWTDSITTFYMFSFCLFYHFHRSKNIFLHFAGILALASFFAKVNTGLVCFAVFILYIIYLIYLKRLRFLPFVVLIATYLGGIFVLGRLLNVNLADYTVNSLHIINGYNEAMTIPISSLFHPLLAVLFMLFFFGSMLMGWTKKPADSYFILFLLFMALSLFILFKQSFVRADGHLAAFFYAFPYYFLFGCFFCNNSVTKKFLWKFFPFVVLFSIHALSLEPGSSVERLLGLKVFKSGSTIEEGGKDLRLLPAGILTRIGKQDVDVVGSEISIVHYNNLNYNPRPVFQSYSAYNEPLAQLNAAAYKSSKGPEVVLFHFGSIDRRHPFWDEPLLLKTLQSHYEVVDSFRLSNTNGPAWADLGPIFYFQKRKQPLQPLEPVILDTSISLNSTFYLPAFDGAAFAEIDLSPSFMGKVRKTLFQPSLPEIELIYADGDVSKFVLIPGIAKLGVPIHTKLEDVEDAMRFFNGEQAAGANKTLAIKITGQAKYIKQNVRIVLRRFIVQESEH